MSGKTGVPTLLQQYGIWHPSFPISMGVLSHFLRGLMQCSRKDCRKGDFFSLTNNINQGALGSWRLGQRKRPCETLHKFNAGQNDTEGLISHMLTKEEKLNLAQIDADKVKVAENHAKETRHQEKRDMFWRL